MILVEGKPLAHARERISAFRETSLGENLGKTLEVRAQRAINTRRASNHQNPYFFIRLQRVCDVNPM